MNNMQNTLDGKYKYFAFICYTHADYKEAKSLHKKLQSFSLPSKIMKVRNKPKKLKPVFLDHNDMLSNPYDEEDYNALKNSKFLIVVCSRNLNSHDENVNAEIRDFLKCRHTYKDIIPYIIDNTKCPEEDCFPSELKRINEQNNINIIGHNIYDPLGQIDRRQAQIKTIARMHNIDAFELDNEDHKRKFRKTILMILSVLLGIVLIIGPYMYISYNKFPFETIITERTEEKTWQENSMEANIGDIVQFQIAFINNRGIMSDFIRGFAQNNCLKISSDNVMVRAVVPDNMEYIDGSTILYNSNHPNGIVMSGDDITTTGLNIGTHYFDANSYLRFSCKIKDRNLKTGNNELITWGTATIWNQNNEMKEEYIHIKDQVSIVVNK